MRLESVYRRQNKDSWNIPPPPELWSRILRRFPKLNENAPTSHIQIAYRGDLIPFSRAKNETGCLPHLRVPFSVELTGSPKAGKTAYLKYVDSLLEMKRIGHEIYPEREVSFPPEDSPSTYNLLLQLLTVSRMTEATVLGREYLSFEEQRVRVYDRAVFNPLAFIAPNESHGGGGLIESPALMAQVAKSAGHLIDAVAIFRASSDVSLARGSRLKKSYLESLGEGFKNLPQQIAWLMTDSSHPIAIIQVDADQSMARYFPATLKSMGTILAAMLNMHGDING